jgi:hypothetical protein
MEKRIHVILKLIRLVSGLSEQTRGENDSKVRLLIRRSQLHKEIKDIVNDVVRTGRWSVNLVDNDESLETLLQGLVEDEARLRLGSFDGIDHQEDTVRHVEDTFDFAAKLCR